MKTGHFEVVRKDWESDFFHFELGLLKFNIPAFSHREFSELWTELSNELTEIIDYCDDRFQITELLISSSQLLLAPVVEHKGFALIDTRITFLTSFDQENLKVFHLNLDNFSIRNFAKEDLGALIDLTIEHLLKEPGFFSKYKNPLFYTFEEAMSYYSAWITNVTQNPKAHISVLIDNATQGIKGYFIYQVSQVMDGHNVYKGILTVVAPECRGKDTHLALQSHIFSQVNDAIFWIDNTTQLTNLPIIRNHIKSTRRLDNIQFIFSRNQHGAFHRHPGI